MKVLCTWRPRIAPLAILLLLPGVLTAEPYMAVRYGYTCSQCHVNPTGGGQRNSFGMSFTQTELPARTIGPGDVDRMRTWLRKPAAAPEGAEPNPSGGTRSTYVDNHLTDFLSVGTDFRFDLTTTVPRKGATTSSMDISEGELYGTFEFLDELLTIYLDEQVAPGGARAREAFGMVRGPLGSYMKAGRIFLPYGIRLLDDGAFIREQTGFNFGVQDLGVELGMEPGPVSASVAVSNGTSGTSDDNRDKQITGMIQYIRPGWRIGAQGSWNNGSASRRGIVGANAGLTFGRLAILGEADYMVDDVYGPAGDITHAVILYGEVDYLLMKGVNLKFTYDYDRPDTAVSRNAFTRVGGGLEVFPTQFTEVKLLCHWRDEADTSGRMDKVVVTFEFHLFF